MDEQAHKRAEEPPKQVTKRKFLSRGSGKAGGIGKVTNDSKVRTPPKYKKSKSTNALYRQKVGGDVLNKLNQSTDREDFKAPRGVSIDGFNPHAKAGEKVKDTGIQSRNNTSANNFDNGHSIDKINLNEEYLEKQIKHYQ